MGLTQVVFKLKHDLANDTELALAELELTSIVGSGFSPVRNLADLLVHIPQLHQAVVAAEPSRFQDVLLRMPYPGAVQGYRIAADDLSHPVNLSDFGRLTFFRDVFFLFSGQAASAFRSLGHPASRFRCSPRQLGSASGQRVTPTLSLHRLGTGTDEFVIRFIPPHCFLECSDHVVRLAQKPTDVDRMYNGMLTHLHCNFQRPFAASVQMGYKWIEDFIDDRRPPNAYASHSLFGLRGRFFPRMVRALLNHMQATAAPDTILDPFAGVGTLGIEASLLGMKSVSLDVNPFFEQVSKAKHYAMLMSDIEMSALEQLRDGCEDLRQSRGRSKPSGNQPMFFAEAPSRRSSSTLALPPHLARRTTDDGTETVGSLLSLINDSIKDPELRRVARLPIAYYAKSMLTKYSRDKIFKCFWAHLSRIIYLRRFMGLLYRDDIIPKPAHAEFGSADVRDLREHVPQASAVLTSPPYTTAVDYMNNDLAGFYLLGLSAHEEVDRHIIGTTRLGRLAAAPVDSWTEKVPDLAKAAHATLARGNARKAACVAKYFHGMDSAIAELAHVLREGGQFILLVCDEQVFGGRQNIRYPVASAIAELAERRGFQLTRSFRVDLTKNSDGDIKNDCVLFFGKG